MSGIKTLDDSANQSNPSPTNIAAQTSLPPSRSSTQHSTSTTPAQPINPFTLRPHQGLGYDEQLDDVLRELRMPPDLFVDLARQLMTEIGVGTSTITHPRQFMSSIQHLKEDYDNNRLPNRFRRFLVVNGRLARLQHLYSELSISSSARSFTNPKEPGASFHIQVPQTPDTPTRDDYPRNWNLQQLQANLEPAELGTTPNPDTTPYPMNRWYGPPPLSTVNEETRDRPQTPERSRNIFSPQLNAPPSLHLPSPRTAQESSGHMGERHHYDEVPSSPHSELGLSYASVPSTNNSAQREIVPPPGAVYQSPTPDNQGEEFNAFAPSFHTSRGHPSFRLYSPRTPLNSNEQRYSSQPPSLRQNPEYALQGTDNQGRQHNAPSPNDNNRYAPARNPSRNDLPNLPRFNPPPPENPPHFPPPPQNAIIPTPTHNPLSNLLSIESKIEVRKPDPFNGTNPRKWKTFITECMITFQAKPNTYQNEQHRVAFASSWLKGNPLTHFSSLLTHNAQHPALFQWNAFTSEFGRLFGPVNNALDAEFELQKLFMSSQERFTSFITRFELEAFETGWNYNAISAQLRRALPNRMRNALQFAPPAANYHELKTILAQIDLQHWIRESEDRLRNRQTFNTRQPAPNQAQDAVTSPPVDEVTTDKPKRTYQQRPPHAPLTEEQKAARRRNGECMICGSTEHWADHCPKSRSNRQIGRATFIVDGETFEVQNHYELEQDDNETRDAEDGNPTELSGNEETIQNLPGEA